MIRSAVSPRADDGSLSPTPHEPADRESSRGPVLFPKQKRGPPWIHPPQRHADERVCAPLRANIIFSITWNLARCPFSPSSHRSQILLGAFTWLISIRKRFVSNANRKKKIVLEQSVQYVYSKNSRALHSQNDCIDSFKTFKTFTNS